MQVGSVQGNDTRELVEPCISVVIPAYNEEEAIGPTIEEFKQVIEMMNVDYEIVVVDNNSTDKTAEVATKHGARVVREVRQGYGNACIKGLREARGKIIVLTEADRTFAARDLKKMLAYLEESVPELRSSSSRRERRWAGYSTGETFFWLS
ncbi:MAG: hypothetical protein B9J98_01075 [Candidatus Terraquivivens tikiterensis]|uniref:Glycosyltransferase 2-like domain-containing protein n=1 Tax=Candidatus Terraquivivens tikiterensis TaxID=1980982 RepID=A0A2R7Y9L6_9ARCH|nr:MAG: hypothetical protein B9J98_01075 [Candidatus Terraquivivens tikiterensis]